MLLDDTVTAEPELEKIQHFLVLLAEITNHIGDEFVRRQLVHFIRAVKENVQKEAAAKLTIFGIIHPKRHDSRHRHGLKLQRHIPTQVFVVTFPSLPISVRLQAFFCAG